LVSFRGVGTQLWGDSTESDYNYNGFISKQGGNYFESNETAHILNCRTFGHDAGIVRLHQQSRCTTKCRNTENTEVKQNDGTTGQTKTAPITFTYFLGDPGDNPPEKRKIEDMITEKTGVTIKYEKVVGDLDQKLGVMIASGDYPDLIYGQNKMSKFVDAIGTNYVRKWRLYRYLIKRSALPEVPALTQL
jgi:hypothetical protein